MNLQIRNEMKRQPKLKVNKTYEAEPLENKLEKLFESENGIEQVTDLVYSEEYQPGNDIRTDRFDVALNGAIAGDLIGKQEKANILAKKQIDDKIEADKKLTAEKEAKRQEIKEIIEGLKGEKV
jgi:hypothetical protein